MFYHFELIFNRFKRYGGQPLLLSPLLNGIWRCAENGDTRIKSRGGAPILAQRAASKIGLEGTLGLFLFWACAISVENLLG